MNEFATLADIMIGLRMLAVVLGLSIVVWWGPSLWRVLADRPRDRDAARAIWVPLAISILMFQAKWLYPGLEDITRLRIWVAAQAAMVITLIAAIYYHGAGDDRFRMRRTMVAHVAMLALCIVLAAFGR